jgi:uncharacterized protein (DUF488 family)
LDEFEDLLKQSRIDLLLDVRTVPRSRHVPHFNSDILMRALSETGVQYRHVKRLGGLRKAVEDSPNMGWRNASFRGFAEYMQTEEFREGVTELSNLVAERRAVLMCAEAVPWRCHRSLIADALLVRRWEVWHIISQTSLQAHQLTPFAVVEGDRIIYPKVRAALKT